MVAVSSAAIVLAASSIVNAGETGDTSTGWPAWLRYIIWAILGFFGATTLGMVMNRRFHGLIFLMPILGAAAWSIYRSHVSGATMAPPIITLAMILLLWKSGAMANLQYLEGRIEPRERPVPGAAQNRRARVFFSYKSQNANIARALAEQLMARGVQVWMAEYQVLTSNYDRFEADLARNLDEAVESCTHALVFTNEVWASSEYCRSEMDAILEHLEDRQRIIEVCIPREKSPITWYPVLETLAHEVYDASSEVPEWQRIRELTERILKRWNLGERPATDDPLPSGSGEVTLQRFGVTFDPGPFGLHVTATRAGEWGRTQEVRLRTELCGHPVSAALTVTPFECSIPSARWGENYHDREYYDAYRKFAAERYRRIVPTERGTRPSPAGGPRKVRLEEEGLHLVFIDGRSHPALTYVSRPLTDRSCTWHRKYVVSIQGATPGEQGEINLEFLTRLPGEEEQQHTAFMRLLLHMDRFAHSIRYETPRGRAALENSFPLMTVRLGYLFGLGYLMAALLPTSASLAWSVLVCLATGLVIGDIINLLRDRTYLRWAWLGQPLSEDLYGRSLPARVSLGLTNELIKVPSAILINGAWGVVSTKSGWFFLGVAALAIAIGCTGVFSWPLLDEMARTVRLAILVCGCLTAGIAFHTAGFRRLLSRIVGSRQGST